MSDHNPAKWVPRDVRKANLSLKNRLQSILHDWHFVRSLIDCDELSQFPLVPNERCGLWYVPPSRYLETAYFKSTDGHTKHWSFSARRLNLHLWPVIEAHGGVTIIDSSRRKLIPDSLLKTVPIWCAVLNSVLYAQVSEEELVNELTSSGLCPQSTLFSTVLEMHKNNWVRTPLEWVAADEQQEISARIGGFVADILGLQLISRDKLLAALGGKRKPLLPRFYYPEGPAPEPFHDLVYYINCVTASRRVSLAGVPLSMVINEKHVNWVYIQGAADDHELWITPDICDGNLSPPIFWTTAYSCKGALNSNIVDETTKYLWDHLDEQDLACEVNRNYSNAATQPVSSQIDYTSVKTGVNDTGIMVGAIGGDTDNIFLESQFPGLKHAVIFSTSFQCTRINESGLKLHRFELDPTKKGAKLLRGIFKALVQEIGVPGPHNPVLILDNTGTDVCCGVALVLLCTYFDHEWSTLVGDNIVDKRTVKRHLGKLCELRKINPSRNTLQSVHSFLITPDTAGICAGIKQIKVSQSDQTM